MECKTCKITAGTFTLIEGEWHCKSCQRDKLISKDKGVKFVFKGNGYARTTDYWKNNIDETGQVYRNPNNL